MENSVSERACLLSRDKRLSIASVGTEKKREEEGRSRGNGGERKDASIELRKKQTSYVKKKIEGDRHPSEQSSIL